MNVDDEVAALRMTLDRLERQLQAAKAEADLCFAAARAATKENLELRKRLQKWADDFDGGGRN